MYIVASVSAEEYGKERLLQRQGRKTRKPPKEFTVAYARPEGEETRMGKDCLGVRFCFQPLPSLFPCCYVKSRFSRQCIQLPTVTFIDRRSADR